MVAHRELPLMLNTPLMRLTTANRGDEDVNRQARRRSPSAQEQQTC